MPDPVARKIYQANLDAVSASVLSGELKAAFDHLAIPNLMATRHCEIVTASAELLTLVLADHHRQLQDRGVVEYRRICTEAAFVPGMQDMIAGRNDTHMVLKDGSRPTPYSSRMVLMRTDGAWKGIWIQTDVLNTEFTILSPDIAAAQSEAHRLMEKTGRADAPKTSDPQGRNPK